MTSALGAPARQFFVRLEADRSAVLMMQMLTFTTGIVDAVGYLGLDRVFTGNMTGNVVILGMALSGADRLPVLGPSIALLAFMFGAALGGRRTKSAPSGWSRATAEPIVAAFAILLGLGVFLAFDDSPARPLALTLTGLLGAAMGLQASIARHVAVTDVTTVVVTSTLTAFASESRLGNARGNRQPRRAVAVVLILAGAAIGAALMRVSLGLCLVVAAVLMLGVLILGTFAAQSPGLAPKPS